MLPHSLTIFVLFLLSCNAISRNTIRREIEWKEGNNTMEFVHNMTGIESKDIYSYQIKQPTNSNKSIKVTFKKFEGFLLEISAREISSIDNSLSFVKRGLRTEQRSILSSSWSYFIIEIRRIWESPDTFVVTLELELVDHGCSYPFNEVTVAMPISVPTKTHKHGCDFLVFTNEKDHNIELTSVGKSGDSVDIDVKMFDSETMIALAELSEEDVGQDLKRNLGKNKTTGHVSSSNAGRFDLLFSAVKDDCKCPSPTVSLTEPNATFTFEIEKHCYTHVCSSSITLVEHLRSSYRLKVSLKNFKEHDMGGMFSLRDGISEAVMFDPQSHMSESLTKYVSVHPTVQLSYRDKGAPTDTYLQVVLYSINATQQKLCSCPPFVSGSNGNVSLSFHVDKSCEELDCVWRLPPPKIMSSEIVVIIHIVSNVVNREEQDKFNLADLDGVFKYEMSEGEHLITSTLLHDFNETVLHYHRYSTDKYLLHDTFPSKINQTHSYNITLIGFTLDEYDKKNQCSNETISLGPNQTYFYTSPCYPHHYAPFLHCRTRFEAPEGYGLVFDQNVFSLGEDYLAIYAINAYGHEGLIGSYSGRKLFFRLSTSRNVALAVFHSDEAISHRGFNITVKTQNDREERSKATERNTYGNEGKIGTTRSAKAETKGKAETGSSYSVIVASIIIITAIVAGILYFRKRVPNQLSSQKVSYSSKATKNDDYDSGEIILGETAQRLL